MLYCDKCKVTVRGNHSCCPLCKGKLSGEPEKDMLDFPIIRPNRQYYKYVRILYVILVAMAVTAFIANLFIFNEVMWSLWIALGVFYIAINLTLFIKKRHNIPKALLWQMLLFNIVVVILDGVNGVWGWSFEYAIPFMYMAGTCCLLLSTFLTPLGVKLNLAYILLAVFLGIFPITGICINKITNTLPLIISALMCGILLLAVVLFKGSDLITELKKRFYM